MTEGSETAEEVSRAGSMLTITLYVIVSPAFVWVSRNVSAASGRFAQLAGLTLGIMVFSQYIIHLLRYNSLVRERLDALYYLFSSNSHEERIGSDEA